MRLTVALAFGRRFKVIGSMLRRFLQQENPCINFIRSPVKGSLHCVLLQEPLYMKAIEVTHLSVEDGLRFILFNCVAEYGSLCHAYCVERADLAPASGGRARSRRL